MTQGVSTGRQQGRTGGYSVGSHGRSGLAEGEVASAGRAVSRTDPQAARIAGLLGLPSPEKMTDVGLARTIALGLPLTALDLIARWFGQPGFATAIVPEATLRRARAANKALSRDHSERVYEIARVLDAALRAYGGDGEAAVDFLSRRHPLLDFERPIDLARMSSAGTDAVIAQIGRAMAGVAI